MRAQFPPKVISTLVLAGVAWVYIAHLPSTVQTGDTGELVTAAAKLLVAHPPGFPLYIWLEALFLRLTPSSGQVFWWASLLNSFYALAALGALALAVDDFGLLGSGLIAALGFSPIFWRFAELPDVFALSAFLAALFLLLLARDRARALPLIFGLGLTVHPTFLFLFPAMALAIWRERRQLAMWLSVLTGLGVCAALYLSLLALHPDALTSWGQVDSVEGFLAHLLRRDYGTFQLSAGHEVGSLAANLTRLGKATLIALGGLLLLTVVTERGALGSVKERMAALCAVIYGLVFFALANTSLEGYRGEVFDRFVILFLVLLSFALATRLRSNLEPRAQFWRWACALVLWAGAGASFYAFHEVNDFSKNTIAEDYALNFLRQVPPHQATIAIVDTDTRFFSIRYAQVVLGQKSEVVLVSPATLIYPWYAQKLVRHAGVKFDLHRADGPVGLQEELIVPNLDRFAFLTNLPFVPQPQYQLGIEPLGRVLSAPGSAPGFDPELELAFRSSAEVLHADPKAYDPYRDLLSDYARGPLIRATLERRAGETTQAVLRLETILKRVPWCWRAQAELCEIAPSADCSATVAKSRADNFDYF